MYDRDARGGRRPLAPCLGRDRARRRRQDLNIARPRGGREGRRVGPVPARFRGEPDRRRSPTAGRCEMIERIIRASVAARGLVVAAALILALVGIYAVRTTPVDDLPDPSAVQVILRTTHSRHDTARVMRRLQVLESVRRSVSTPV